MPVRRHRLVHQHIRGRVLPGPGQVVEEAGQLDLALDPPVHHLGADAAAADQQPLVHQLLDGPPHRRAGQPPPVGEADLILQPVAGLEVAALDGGLDLPGHLEVERHRAGPVEIQDELRHGSPRGRAGRVVRKL
jgi:hypothetical protein